MEKISALIDKLQELKTTGATLQSISYYVQLLQAEILHARSLERERERELQRQQSNIAVIMPVTPITDPVIPEYNITNDRQVTASLPIPPVEEYKQPEQPVSYSKPAEVNDYYKQPEEAVNNNYSKPAEINDHYKQPEQPLNYNKPVETAPQPVYYIKPEPATPPAETPSATPAQPAAADVPPPAAKEQNPVFITLFGQPEQPVVSAIKPENNGMHRELKELNQKIAQTSTSVNDRLRQGQGELADRFSEAPVKDLRQAIGIADKFQFIQELFRGDVDTYERSIKTINEMHSLQDAEYWIERELKIRQGWDDDNRAVRQFYALVKKRFS